LSKIAPDPVVVETLPPGNEEVAEIPKAVTSKVSSSMTIFAPLGDHTTTVIRFVADITKKRGASGTLPVCDAPLASVSKKDIAAMVGGLLYLLKHEVSEAAVGALFEKYAAVSDLEKSYTESKEMLKGLCKRILADKQWAKAKLFFTAALSTIDMFTDILMVFEFMREKKTGFAHTMMGSIFANLAIQLGLVIMQNFKLG